jgi:hypothetical protein
MIEFSSMQCHVLQKNNIPYCLMFIQISKKRICFLISPGNESANKYCGKTYLLCMIVYIVLKKKIISFNIPVQTIRLISDV